MTTITIIGQRIKTRREDRGLSQRDVADMLGTTPSLISRYETGSLIPPTVKLQSLANALQCSVQYLTGETYDTGFTEHITRDHGLPTVLHAIIDRMSDAEQLHLARYIYYMMPGFSEEEKANHTLRRYIVKDVTGEQEN